MKRTQNSVPDEEILKKIRRYERKLNKQRLKLNTTMEDTTCDTEIIEVDTVAEPSPITDLGLTERGPMTVPPSNSEITVVETDNPVSEVPAIEDTLPEEFLIALGEEGKITEQKGENIRQEIVDRWTNMIKMGIPKENWPKLLNKYLTPGNFPMAIAPKLNSELVAALSENIVKRDKKFEYRQNLVGKVLSCLGSMLTEIMKGNLNSLKLIEGINDSAKILCNMNHYDNIVRKHFALSSLQNCVKQAVANIPADSYLFGENLGERLKAAKALERNGSLLQNTPLTKKQPVKFNYMNKPHLNWKGPSRKESQNNRTRGGPRNNQQYQPNYQNQPYQPSYQNQQYQPNFQNYHTRRPAPRPQQSRPARRR